MMLGTRDGGTKKFQKLIKRFGSSYAAMEFIRGKKEMTPQPHDFKDADTAWTNWLEMGSFDGGSSEIALRHKMETIRFALRLAERVCGEPSEGMVKGATPVHHIYVGDNSGFSREIFKAMISEALKDIENG